MSAPTPYSPSPTPLDAPLYVVRELRAIATTLRSILLRLPQVATAEPKVITDGMQRLARSPWWPAAGQVADAWVYYDEPSTTWKFL